MTAKGRWRSKDRESLVMSDQNTWSTWRESAVGGTFCYLYV